MKSNGMEMGKDFFLSGLTATGPSAYVMDMGRLFLLGRLVMDRDMGILLMMSLFRTWWSTVFGMRWTLLTPSSVNRGFFCCGPVSLAEWIRDLLLDHKMRT